MSCPFNARAALTRVFLPHARTRGLPRLTSHVPTRSYYPDRPPRRNYPSAPAPGQRYRRPAPEVYMTKEMFAKTGRDRLPRDHEIIDHRVMLAPTATSAHDKPIGPMSPASIRERLSQGECLQMLSLYVPADQEAGKPAQLALCKVVDRQAEYAKSKRKREAAGEKRKVKIVELTWSTGSGDLETKINKATEFVGKGHQVGVNILRKKKMKIEVGRRQGEEMVRTIRQALEKCGAAEIKTAEGDVLGTYRMVYEKRAWVGKKLKEGELVGGDGVVRELEGQVETQKGKDPDAVPI